MSMSQYLTGIKYLDLKIFAELDDISIMRYLSTNSNLYTDKNIEFIFGKRYPDLIKYRDFGENVKALYVRMLKYIGLLKEKYNFIYKSGNPVIQYEILQDRRGPDPLRILHDAIAIGNLELLEYAISKGAEIDAYGHLNIVKYFIQNGFVDIGTETEPLEAAIVKNHLHIVKFLMENKGNLSILDFYPHEINGIHFVINLAIEHGHTKIFKYLVSKTEIGKENYSHYLNLAMNHNRLKIVQYLKI